MYKIMVVEDDEIIAGAIASHLQSWDYEAESIKDFTDIMPFFIQFAPQLVLMDVKLPFHNGFHWCKEIRKVSKVPIIFISSAADNMNIVMAVNMGADDFIAKPFDLNVLTVKIQAMLRRTYDFTGQSSLIEHNGVMLNLLEATVTFGEEKVELTKNELKILQVLMEQKNRVVPREELMEKLWENDSYVDENTLSINMNRLRKKLEEIGLTEFIITKKGIGYRVG